MHVREIPSQLFDEMSEGHKTELHDFHALVKAQGQRGLKLLNYGPIVKTADMGHDVWLRLSDKTKTTDLEVILADDIPVDLEAVGSVFNTRQTIGKLSAGSFGQYMSKRIEQTVHIELLRSGANLKYPATQESIRAARIIHAIPIFGEIARKGFLLLHSGVYETSSYDDDEINPVQ